MCRIEERVYIRADGNSSKFQDPFYCEKGRLTGKICYGATINTRKYHDPTSSPIPSSPLTPTHNSQKRRGSMSSRPSTREGPITSLKPEIHIEIGTKKGKGKSYLPTVTVNMGKSKRESTGSTYTYESPGSEASHTIRTGHPEISPPFRPSHAAPHPQRGHRYKSSDESFVGSSHIAHSYHNPSDYDTPSLATGTTATSSGSKPIIHNGQRNVPSPANTTRGQAGSSSFPYKTAEVVPREMFNEGNTRAERSQRPTSSRGVSAAPEIIDRAEARERQRTETRRQQKAADYAAAQLQEENAKHVRFETARADERAKASFAAREQRQADDREHIRQQQRKEREAQAAEEAAAKEAARRQKPSRRGSVRKSAAEAAEQQRLLDADAYQMEQERIAAEAIEREEQIQKQQAAYQAQPIYQTRQPASTLQQQQHDLSRFDPRAPGVVPSISRRNSQSSQSRPTLGRTPSKRGDAPQARESRTQPRQPPVSFYNHPSGLPQARERRLSQSNNPLGQPAPTGDPWDLRNVAQALPTQNLPSARGPGVGHNFPQPQHATQRLNQAFHNGDDETYLEGEPYHRRR